MMHRSHGEDCGVVAIYTTRGTAAELAHRALFRLQHRGQEAAGIAVAATRDDITHLKGVGLVADCLPTYNVKKLTGPAAIGHVRYSTVSVDRSENIQPFLATTPYGRFAIAHNGNLKNADALQKELEAAGSLISTTMDTELMVHLLARSGSKDFEGALTSMAGRVEGAYSLTMICDGQLWALRDPHGVRPLVVGEFADGWVVASETCALNVLKARFVREVEPGELVRIGPDGVQGQQLLEPKKPAPCVFELVYFSRPDSVVFGRGASRARTAMGEALAREDAEDFARQRPDIVVPIPDSGFQAAIGYARESGVPLEKAIIRSHYVGRTFILPDQDSRSNSINLKLSAIPDAVQGKHVVLVDDSIVRGNTSRQIVEMIREAGAKTVWLRIASPPLAWPCYLGIDTPDRDELVINREKSVEGVCAKIGADNLRYLSIDGLATAVGGKAYCYACMDGEYPT